MNDRSSSDRSLTVAARFRNTARFLRHYTRWGELLKDCRRRGLNQPACSIGDGALGRWAAINEQSPQSAQQRCTNHKPMNVIDKLPQAEQSEAVKRARAIWQADRDASE